ncbi:MAG: hypothetical protein COA43_09390 [Robiginitomaculum sp.]|nr:MAG: hypothetical protein COA43_09390 [Robiginitomaculum sp.]
MSNIVLSVAKTAGTNLLHTAKRMAISHARRTIYNALDNRVFEGPQLETLHIQSSRNGAPMASVFGRVRIAGQVIWAARVKEHVTETRQGVKGGPRTREYDYTLSFAVGLCEGEILGIDQIWANGQPLQMEGLNMRVYTGTHTQTADPLIAEIEGGDVPAFKGTAYVVFEDMPVDDFGGRLPQLNFEIIRMPKRINDEKRLEDLVLGVDMIPGSGEFAYGTSITEQRLGPGTTRPVNMNNLSGRADIECALDQLETQLPNCKSVTLVVSWFGDDLRASHCKIRPGVEGLERKITPKDWQVSGDIRSHAYVVSQIDGSPTYGGTPDDMSVIEAIKSLKARGFKVSLYPFILMDISADNQLPNPYGGTSQPALPWRGRITCAPDIMGSAAARQHVSAFFGECSPSDYSVTPEGVSYTGAPEYSLRRMILHYAHIANLAGGVDGFVIGSELRGLTTIRDETGAYPTVHAFKSLAGDVRTIVGADTKLTYAADWSEYFGHHPQDGTGDVLYHLDPLWADPNIDAIGIDAYLPLSDWRAGDDHHDALIAPDIYDLDYLRGNIEGGEGYEWYYASAQDRTSQTRTPITDGLANKPWVFRYKDIRNWWQNPHHERIGGDEMTASTAWIPQSKPIWFTEIGCPAIDKGANQPNVFWDPKSSESYAPYFSDAVRDDLIQRRYLEAFISYWDADDNNPSSTQYIGKMIDTDMTHIWCWDARPYPDFPARKNIWSDGDNWQLGHWLSGRTGLVSLADVVAEITVSSGSPLPDVSHVHGMLSGFVIDRPMSARSALTPLSLVYGFDLIEGSDGLKFASKGVQSPVVIQRDDCVNREGHPIFTHTYDDADARVKDVRLGFIEKSQSYQSGSVTAQGLLSEAVRVLNVQAPLVFDTAQAKQMSQSILAQTHEENSGVELVLPPKYLGLETGDILYLNGQDGSEDVAWLITQKEGLSQNVVKARREGARRPLLVNTAVAGAGGAPVWSSTPDVFALDIPDITNDNSRQGVLVGAVVHPWVQTSVSFENAQTTSLRAPVSIGYLKQDLKRGNIALFDNHPAIEIYLPNIRLASISDAEMLAGGNLLAVETQCGWEIFQCQDAVLIGVDIYRIHKFLRGRYGSDSDMDDVVNSGARVIYLGQGWQDLRLSSSLRGLEIKLTAKANGRRDTQKISHIYHAAHLRPYCVVHVKAKTNGQTITISWVRRTRVDGDDWVSREVPLGEDTEMYEIDICDGDNVLATLVTQIPELNLTLPELETLYGFVPENIHINIFQMSRIYGRGAGTQYSFSP